MQSLIRFALSSYVRYERRILAAFATLFILSLSVLLVRFYYASSVLVPSTGGTYIEGSVGEIRPLNPWFTVQNDVNGDIVSLVFSGLLRYDPDTNTIGEDLASYTVSKDGKNYTVTLKEGVQWHDSSVTDPHPVTADDVVFTFETIKDPAFPNSLLRQNFRGVAIEKIDDRTVQFRLDQPYGFFTSNLTLGILPKKSFQDVPVKLLNQTLDFGFQPIGAGPYRLKNISQTDLSTEVTLERFERPVPPTYRLDRLVFRIFSDYRSMLSDVRNLDGIRLIAHTDGGKPIAPDRFTTVDYTLPQYVALFFNMDRGTLRDQKLRLGLQLGTNKQEVVDNIGLAKIVDTPFLELKQEAWEYAFDSKAAQGALFESSWYYPEKIRLQKLLEQREANVTGLLKVEPIVLLDTGAALTVSGVGGGLSGKDRINGLPLRSNPTESGGWIVALPTHGGTGALKVGMNLIRLTDENGAVLDSAYVLRTADGAEFQRAAGEQRLIESFLSTRSGELTGAAAVGSSDMILQDGYLRGRKPEDPVSIRINDRGEQLNIRLLTSPQPDNYAAVAKLVAEQWRKLGVNVTVDVPATRAEFEEKLLKRDYDVLLFGQSLLDNLDSYPYWHSSGVQKITGKRADLRLDAYNLSQYASFESDTLLEQIRGNASSAQRQTLLQKLQEQFRKDVPAVFVYSPVYTFAHREDIQGITVGRLSLHSDRFRTLYSWYIKQDRRFRPGVTWLSFFGWMFGLGKESPAPTVSGSGTVMAGSGAVE